MARRTFDQLISNSAPASRQRFRQRPGGWSNRHRRRGRRRLASAEYRGSARRVSASECRSIGRDVLSLVFHFRFLHRGRSSYKEHHTQTTMAPRTTCVARSSQRADDCGLRSGSHRAIGMPPIADHAQSLDARRWPRSARSVVTATSPERRGVELSPTLRNSSDRGRSAAVQSQPARRVRRSPTATSLEHHVPFGYVDRVADGTGRSVGLTSCSTKCGLP